MLQNQALSLLLDKETGKIYPVVSSALFAESLDAKCLFKIMYCNADFCDSQQDLGLQSLKTLQGNFTFPVPSLYELVGRLLLNKKKKEKEKNKT